jgi:hypothetical protein
MLLLMLLLLLQLLLYDFLARHPEDQSTTR